MGAQRMTTGQMIPTPGFNNNNRSSDSNQPFLNLESGFSSVESTMVALPQQHVEGQNSHILHNLGSHMSSGLRSGSQHNLGFSNGAFNGGLGMIGNGLHLVSKSGATPHSHSTKPLQQQLDQHQRIMVGDRYAMGNADYFGVGNFYGGSVPNSQNLSSVNMQSMPMSKTPSVIDHLNLHGAPQAAIMKSSSVHQSEKINFHPPLTSRDGLLQFHEQQQFHRFQQPQEYAFGRPQLMSDMSKVKGEHGIEQQHNGIHSQVSEPFQLSEAQNQFQQGSSEDRSGAAQHLSVSSSQHLCSSTIQVSQPRQQMLHPHQMITASPNSFSVGLQSEWHVPGQWQPQLQDRTGMTGSVPHENHIQEEFQQRRAVQGEAQGNNLSSDGSMVGQPVDPSSSIELMVPRGVTCRSSNGNRDRQYRNQQRWLLFLRHARRCQAPEGKCQEVNCITVQKLWRHMDRCNSPSCPYPRCRQSKILIHHHKHCRDPCCPVCVFVKNYLQRQKERARPNSDSQLPSLVSASCKSYSTTHVSGGLISKSPVAVETSEDLQPYLKRLKIDQSSQCVAPESEISAVLASTTTSQPRPSQDVQCQDYQHGKISVPVESEFMDVKMEVPLNSGLGSLNSEMKDKMGAICEKKLDESAASAKQENFKVEKENVAQPGEKAAGTQSGKPKIKGVSLAELFTPEQVREHITSLRQWVGQSKAKAEKNQAMEHSMSENCCQLCAVANLTFEPPPIYCSPCGARIKRNAMYHTIGAGDTRHYFCIHCYNEARGDNIVVDGTAIPKARLEKKKNDKENDEPWVQCDKCEAWQHQICALFNSRRNDGGQAEYTCPYCYIKEVDRGERKPLPQSVVLGAKDLPRTLLSDHIEQRLFKRLKNEREERARMQGKSYDEVQGAESLVIRVVSSVDKKLEVKQRFLEIFQEENYPTECPYKSKVILLFQKIEGVEVCLFGMYVQEFGSECQFPNQRRVYLSYLDSVKYFRPEIKAVTGEALRTFVYHEILIGYLEYCKMRGFTSCYIWACPPLKGEDYILYCHPEIQKTPKPDKLREWYLCMLRKAGRENIVVELTNLYDHFFVTTGECRAKVTAARLPYFDGDYWPGAAEDLIYQIRQEEDGKKPNKKGVTKKTITKRALKASGQTDLSGNASKDLLLMHKLGETIRPMKEDFIMVHLQHACTHCCILMVSGTRHTCKQCKNFQLCDKCFEAEKKREDRERHPRNSREVHPLEDVPITCVPDTKDKDEILESEFFDTRQAFLSLCQGNHYQYDTLRRAKHTSMMVLYHLHNPTAPAFVTTCSICLLDVESGQGWRCEVCPDYDVCKSCYEKDGGIDHPHKLTNHASDADHHAQNKEARQIRVLQLRKMLDLLVHASQCRSPHCEYTNCRKVKGLFRHGIQCKTRASKGCLLCKKMWYLLQLHARSCKESECYVPRCRDLKEHVRRVQQQSDSRRRAAMMEMMRQRAAEVAGNVG